MKGDISVDLEKDNTITSRHTQKHLEVQDSSNGKVRRSRSITKQSLTSKKKAAVGILESVKLNNQKRGKSYLPLKQTLKCITMVYNERLKEFRLRQIKNDQLFIEYLYDFYIKSFGFTSIAEPKLIAFLISVKSYSKKSRICLFSKFVGLDPNEEYSNEEINKYIEGLDFLATSNMGHPIANNEMETEHLCAYIRGLEFLKKFCEEMNIPQAEISDLRRDMDRLKQDHNMGNVRVQVVNVDSFLEIIVRKYSLIIGATKQYVVNAFNASDLDNNGYCSEDEFHLLWKYLNPDSYEEGAVSQTFEDRADKEIEGEAAMSFDRFCAISAEFSLFSEEKQFKFLQVSGKSKMIGKYKSLKVQWPMIREELKRRVVLLNQNQKNLDWDVVIDQIDERMLKCNEKDIPALLISCKILECEVFSNVRELHNLQSQNDYSIGLEILLDQSELKEGDQGYNNESNRSKDLKIDQSVASNMINNSEMNSFV